MGYDGKYGKVTTEHGDIPDDEPVIVFRARDLLTGPLISEYYLLCKMAGSPERHLGLVQQAWTRFANWQEANEDKTRMPDSERSRAWLPE